MKDKNGNWHIKVETRTDGWARWFETESTDERTLVFENWYDEEAVPRSEELVAWIWGEFDTEEEVKIWATEKRLKAEYNC